MSTAGSPLSGKSLLRLHGAATPARRWKTCHQRRAGPSRPAHCGVIFSKFISRPLSSVNLAIPQLFRQGDVDITMWKTLWIMCKTLMALALPPVLSDYAP